MVAWEHFGEWPRLDERAKGMRSLQVKHGDLSRADRERIKQALRTACRHPLDWPRSPPSTQHQRFPHGRTFGQFDLGDRVAAHFVRAVDQAHRALGQAR